jgi:formylglycine-generating enzyme required for sulfatase activity
LIGVYPVTQGQWQAVMGGNPSRFPDRDDHPVEAVSWSDSQAFCTRLGQAEGRAYRLPTEAEWEHACRAGTATPFHFGAALTTDQANYNGVSGTHGQGLQRERTTPVGSFPPNAWGLYDMHGNVWEWCADWYAAYPGGDCVDPVGPSDGSKRVVRGGSWLGSARLCRSACRTKFTPASSFGYIGCRLCLCAD